MNPTVYIIMGVSGCGKTTVGQLLAGRLNIPFFDADDFHPPANVAKMRNGTPLNDDDRMPWLETLSNLINTEITKRGAILACSALKQCYRAILTGDHPSSVAFIYLKGDKDLIQRRMQARSGHFMPATLLNSQFAVLEEPTDAITVSIAGSPDDMVAEIGKMI